MGQPLDRSSLADLQSHLLSSTWTSPEIGIVHLGLGNFHRAHQAVYTEEAVIRVGGDFAICGVTLQGATTKRDILNDQDGLYCTVQRGAEGNQVNIIRILKEVLALPHDWPSLQARLGHPGVKIVSLTVTEKGYCRDSDTGRLQVSHPHIIHDLANPESPKTTPGIILAGLYSRMQKNIPPFTVLSCDNLSHNGQAVRTVVLDLAHLLEESKSAYRGLAAWIMERCEFPSTMVDRIVPASTEQDVRTVLNSIHRVDKLPVPCEPFRQWVIEDKFSDGRPAWDTVGVQLVSDVTPFELAKLRMLNAAHSTLAYLSLLTNLKTIDEAILHPSHRRFVEGMLTSEVIPTLKESLPSGFDIYTYRDDLLQRFTNPALKHRCAQISADGSQKIPLRFLGTISDRIAMGQPFPRLACAVAAWMVFLRGHSDTGDVYEIQDPLGVQLSKIYAATDGTPHKLLDEIFQQTQIVPSALANKPVFRDAVVKAMIDLQGGVFSAIDALL